MLKLSKKTEYAIISIIDMSNNGDDELATARELSRKYNIPQELLGKVLQSMVREGLIESQQGIKGGYRLTRPLDEINIYSVISAAEGPINLVDCVAEDDCDCGVWTNCNIRTPMELIQLELKNFFNGITLQDFKEKYVGQQPLLQIGI